MELLEGGGFGASPTHRLKPREGKLPCFKARIQHEDLSDLKPPKSMLRLIPFTKYVTIFLPKPAEYLKARRCSLMARPRIKYSEVNCFIKINEGEQEGTSYLCCSRSARSTVKHIKKSE